MAEYIEREAVVKYLRSRKGDFIDDYGNGWSAGMGAASGICGKFPAADVAPVVRGRWDLLDDANSKIVKWNCDRCNRISTSKTDYCPNCGADMREGVSG